MTKPLYFSMTKKIAKTAILTPKIAILSNNKLNLVMRCSLKFGQCSTH